MDPPSAESTTSQASQDGSDNGHQEGLLDRNLPRHEPELLTPGVVSAAGMLLGSHQDQVINRQSKSDSTLPVPHFNDQVQAGGFGSALLTQCDRTSIPRAQSVHIVVDEDPAPDPAKVTQPAKAILAYPSGINAKNTVGPFKKSPEGAANHPGSMFGIDGDNLNDKNNIQVSASTPPPVPPEWAFNSQQIVLRKHLIWAGAAVLIVVVVAVVVAVVILVGGGNSSAVVQIEQPPSIPESDTPLPTRAPSRKVTPSPSMVDTTEAPIEEALLVTVEPTTTPTTKSLTVAPTKPTTQPPSTLAPTQIFSEIPTAATGQPGITIDSEIKLLASDGADGDWFGNSVAIDGDTILIGAHTDDTDSGPDSGSAYVYTLAGTVWTEQAKLTASDGAAYDWFGNGVAIDGDTIVIGAYGDDTESGENSGSAYVYTLSANVWTEQAKLTASGAAAYDYFGNSVAIYGDTIVIGARWDATENGENSGSAYVYTRIGTVWTEQAKLMASDGAAGDWFGIRVAINGDTIVIGAYGDDTENGESSGSAYVYTNSATVWTEQTKLTANDGAANEHFGVSVAIDGSTIAIGAAADDTGSGPNSGSAYVYTRIGTVWTEQVKLWASDGAAVDWFGKSLATNGDTIVIGAYQDDTENGTNGGSAYVYTFVGAVWTEQVKLTASDGAANEHFGVRVAIDRDTIVIGANSDDTENGEKSGSAYIYII